MPLTYRRDDAQRRVVLTLEGQFDPADVLAALKRYKEENVAGYALLYDVRHVQGQPTMDDLRVFVSERTSTHLARGPIAFVVTAPDLYRMACTYVAMAGPAGFSMEVFRDMGEAEDWLKSNTSTG